MKCPGNGEEPTVPVKRKRQSAGWVMQGFAGSPFRAGVSWCTCWPARRVRLRYWNLRQARVQGTLAAYLPHCKRRFPLNERSRDRTGSSKEAYVLRIAYVDCSGFVCLGHRSGMCRLRDGGALAFAPETSPTFSGGAVLRREFVAHRFGGECAPFGHFIGRFCF